MRDRFNGRGIHGDNNNIGWVSQIIEINDGLGAGTGCFRTIVNSTDAEMMTFEMQTNYEKKSFVSYDVLFRPVSLAGDDCGTGQHFPRISIHSPPACLVHEGGSGGDPCTKTGTTVSIYDTTNIVTWDELNPVSNPSGLNYDTVPDTKSDTSTIGHDIDLISRCGTERNNTPEGGLIMYPAEYEQGDPSNHKADYQDDYRFMGLKTPVVVTGWGYTCDGYPIPNKIDTVNNTKAGTFVLDNTRNRAKFMDNHLRNPFSWPTAPLDLKYDSARNVWVSGGPAESFTPEAVITVEVCANVLLGATADGLVINNLKFYRDTDGTEITDAIIQFEAKTDLSAGQEVTLIKRCDCYEMLMVGSGAVDCQAIIDNFIDGSTLNERSYVLRVDLGALGEPDCKLMEIIDCASASPMMKNPFRLGITHCFDIPSKPYYPECADAEPELFVVSSNGGAIPYQQTANPWCVEVALFGSTPWSTTFRLQWNDIGCGHTATEDVTLNG